jgi:hypothetical protein
MPGVITHLACAEKYLRQNPRRDFKKFILGTIFPDIRYFAKVDRDLTHKKFKPALNLSRLDSFKAGWKFHIYIDSQWNKIVRSSFLYERYQNDRRNAWTSAKIIEDRIDYKKINDVGRCLRVIKNPGSGTTLHIPREKIKFYYSMTADYLMTKNYKAYTRQIFNQESIAAIRNKTEEMKRDKELAEFLSRIVERILP